MAFLRVHLTIAFLGLTACNSPCQQLCVRMADYADECGINVSDSALQTCIDEQADSSEQGACRRAGNADTLRREWDCEDLRVFFE